MRSVLVTALHLPIRAWTEIATVGIVALLVEVGLRSLRLTRLATLLGVPLASAPEAAVTTGPLDLPYWGLRRIELIGRVMRHWPWDATCLRKSLVAGHRLRALHPSLVVGVALVDGQVRAHAWLTIDGKSLDPSGAAMFGSLGPIAG